MFVASYRNTMASAKPKIVIEAEKPISIVEIRKRKRIEVREERVKEKGGFNHQLEQQRLVANMAIARGNMALRRLNDPGVGFGVIALRICRALNVPLRNLQAHRRDAKTVIARHAVMYWACRRTTLSVMDISRRLHRDHTTVLHGRDAYPAKRAKMGRTLREVR